MTSTPKPFVLEAGQVAVMLPPFKTIEETGDAIDRIALALSQAYSRGLEDAAVCAQGFDDRDDILKISGYGVAKAIRALGSK